MNINKMMQQAQILQNKLKKAMIEFDKEEFIFSDSNNLITITITGNLEIQKIDINELELINPSDPEMLKAALTATVNGAIKDVTNKRNLRQKEITGSSNMPGINGIF